MIIVFHDYSTITRFKYALFWPRHFRPFSTVNMLELCQSFKSHLLCRFALNSSLLFEIVLLTGGGLNPGHKSLYFVHLCCVCGAVVAVQVSYHPHFERACSARHPDIGFKSFFCATYHANSWSNCVRIANVCRIRKYARKSESVEKLLDQGPPANQE